MQHTWLVWDLGLHPAHGCEEGVGQAVEEATTGYLSPWTRAQHGTVRQCPEGNDREPAGKTVGYSCELFGPDRI